jgi:hypothetical protein
MQRKGNLERSVGKLEQTESEHRHSIIQLTNEMKQHRASLNVTPQPLESSPPRLANGVGGATEPRGHDESDPHKGREGVREKPVKRGTMDAGERVSAGLMESWMVSAGGETEGSDVAMDMHDLESTVPKVSAEWR